MRADHDPVGRLFARLTDELEDTCALAVEGQNPQLPFGQRSVLALHLRRRLGRAATTIDCLDAAIARLREADK